MTEPEITVVADRDAGAALAADHIARVLAETVAARGRADWATTGGSTPVWIYRHLIEPRLATTVPWESVHVWWGDDRYVQRDHPYSNVKAFDDIMLGIGSTEEGTAGARIPGVPIQVDERAPVPDGRGDRLGSWRGLVRGRDGRRAPRRAPGRDRRLAGARPGPPRDRPGRAPPVCLRGLAGPRLTRPRAGDPGSDPHRAGTWNA